MAGEKITLEVVSKLVDKGFKLAKQQIEQIRKLEQKRFKQNVLQDTRALIAAKGNYKEEQRIISRMEDTDRKNTINRIRRARQLTNIKISGIKKTEKAFNDLFRKQRQALKEIKRRSGFDRNIYIRKQRLAIKTAEAERRAARKTAAEEIRQSRIVDRVRKKVARDRIARTKRNEKAVRSEARKTAQVRRQALGSIKQGYSSIIGTLGKLTVAAGIAGYALVSAAKKVLSVGAGFEQSIVNVGAIANMTDQQMSRIGNKARELGAQTAYTATEVANGMADLARAGLKANDIMGAIGPTLYLAGAAGADMTQATKLMARTMAQFGLGAEHAANVADTFTLAMQNSLLDIESLDSSMRYAGAAAGAFGWDIQQTTAAVSLFMDQTGMGSTAGTQFRHVLLSLAGPTAAAQQVIKDLARTQGVTYETMRDKLNPATSDFATILQNLKPIMQDHDKILKLVNKRSSGTLQKILKDYHTGQSKYDELTTMFAKGGGAALITYDKQMGTVLGKQKIVASKIQEAMLQLFTAQASPISKFLDFIMVQMDDVILVFDAMSRVITDNLTVAFQEFESGMGGTRSAGEQVATLFIQITQSVVWFIKNLPQIAKNIYSIIGPLLRIAFIVKGMMVVKDLIKITSGLSKTIMTQLLPAVQKTGNAAAASSSKMAGMGKGLARIGKGFLGMLGGGLLTGGLFMAADWLLDYFNPIEEAMDGVSEKMVSSTEDINAQTDALRKAREEYERYKGSLGGGELAIGSVAEIKRTTTSMLDKTDDENLKNALLKQKNIDVAKVGQQTEVGKLIYTDDALITDKMKQKLTELAGENKRFLVSMDVLYATAKSLSDDEYETFRKNLKNKAEELKKFQSSISRFSKIEAEGIRESLSERIRTEALGGRWGRYGRGSKKEFMDKPVDGLSEREKRLRKEIELAEKLETHSRFLFDEESQTKLYKLEHHGLEGAIKARLQLLGILEDQKNVQDTIGEIEEDDKIKNMSAIIEGLSTKLKELGEVEALGYTEIDNLSKSLIDFYGETGSYANAEKEITSVLSAAGKSADEINTFSSEIMGKLKLIEMSPERIRRDMEKLMGEGYELFGPDQMKNLVGSGVILNDLIKLSEELGDQQQAAYGNVARALVVEKEILNPIKQQYDMAKKYGNLTADQIENYDRQYAKMTGKIEAYNKALVSGHVAEIASLRDEVANIWTDSELTTFIGMLKNIGGAVVGQVETLEAPTDPEKEAREAEQDRRNKEYINKLKAFYKKLFQMEKSQQQRLDKIREDESDSLANALKRRLDKTREFFEEGYRLLRNNTSRTIALRRREERLLNQIRLEERIKLAKAAQKELEQVEGEIFKLENTPYQQAVEKSRKDRLKAQEDFQKAINLVAKTGSKERLEQAQRDSDALRDITSKAKKDRFGKIKRYAPKVSSLDFARIGEPESGGKSRQQIFDDLLARRRQALLDNDKEGLQEINKEYQEQIKLQEESLKITNLYAALLEKRSTSGKRIGKKDMVEFQGLSPKTIQDATKVVNNIRKKGVDEALDIARQSAVVRQSINSRNVLSFHSAEENMTEALETETTLRDEKVRKAGLELTKWKEDNIYKPLEIMEKDITAVFETTQGDQTKREREEIKKRLEEQLGGYDKALEELKVYDRKRRAIATKAMMDSDLGFDLRDDMSPMNASWWKTRRMELENELLSGPSLNSLFQRAFDVEMKALDTRTPEGAKERLLAEAESLRALAKLYREHEDEKRSIRKEYRLDETYVSEEDRRMGQKQLALVTERQKKEMDAAKKAAKDAAAGIAHYFKVAGEKIGAAFNSAFGPIYAVYQFFQNILDITSSLIGKIKSGIDFFTGGNLELNPFTLMTEAANELLAHMDEIIEKQKALDEQYQAGRISQDEYKKNQEVLNLEKKNARAVAKETVDKMIDESIRFMDALIKVAPMIIEQLIKRLPEIMEALRKMVPMLGKIVDELFPVLVPVLTKLFTLAAKIFFQVLSELLFGGFMGNKKVSKKPGKKAVKAGTVLAPTSTGDDEIYKPRLFGDTPYPIPVSNSGMLARFSPGDTVIAAKKPMELLRQSLMAVGSEVKMGTRRPPPPSSSATQGGSSGGSSRIDIAVIAEGRVLDAVQMQAMDRGHAPKIAKRLRKASGVKVGFNRGRYNKFAVNES